MNGWSMKRRLAGSREGERGKVATDCIPEGWPQPLHRLDRYRHLLRLFRNEQDDPSSFYRYLASETLQWLAVQGLSVAGIDLLDVGAGPGIFSAAFSAAGAHVVEIDLEPREFAGNDGMIARESRIVIGDAASLPFQDSTFDAIFSSNTIEHVPAGALQVIKEAERVMRPGAWFYLSWTNWYSPWGGHAISPYHYLGSKLGLNVYRRLHGEPSKNVPGQSLFPVHIGQVVRIVRRETGLVMRAIVPRYYPNFAIICQIPGLRELLAWNCLILLEKPHRPE